MFQNYFGFGGVKPKEAKGTLTLVDKDSSPDSTNRFVLSNPNDLTMKDAIKLVDNELIMDTSSSFAPKPLVFHDLKLEKADRLENEELHVELELLDAAENTTFRIDADKVLFKGNRTCATKFAVTEPLTAGKKLCGPFEVTIPVPDCYDFVAIPQKKKSWVKVMDQDAKNSEFYTITEGKFGSWLFSFELLCKTGCCEEHDDEEHEEL